MRLRGNTAIHYIFVFLALDVLSSALDGKDIVFYRDLNVFLFERRRNHLKALADDVTVFVLHVD